jgi:hypothetical protein
VKPYETMVRAVQTPASKIRVLSLVLGLLEYRDT